MKTEQFLLLRNDWVPNNPRLPVIVYRGALSATGAQDAAAGFERLFAAHGWPPQWRNGVFDYHHYHSTTHEALGFAAGFARLTLGGPGGREIRVEAGDAALLPVGTGHCRIEASDDFLVIGAYPPGFSFDIRRTPPSPAMIDAMATMGAPASDPVAGKEGPMTRLWRA